MSVSPTPDVNQTSRKAWVALIGTILVMQAQWLINGGVDSEVFWQWLGSRLFAIVAPGPDETWHAMKALIFATIGSALGGSLVGKAVHLATNKPLT